MHYAQARSLGINRQKGSEAFYTKKKKNKKKKKKKN